MEFDGQTMFALAFTIVAVAIAFGTVAFALWYGGDQTEL